jgi:hypothetical protein
MVIATCETGRHSIPVTVGPEFRFLANSGTRNPVP